MLVLLAIVFTLFGGPSVSVYDATAGGPSHLAATPVAYDNTSGGPSAPAPVDDANSGGPSHP